jgi:hypothetical protein
MVLYAIKLNLIEGGLLVCILFYVLDYPWEIIGIYYAADLPISGSHGYTLVFIKVCHLTIMGHCVPCHEEISAEESSELFIDIC